MALGGGLGRGREGAVLAGSVRQMRIGTLRRVQGPWPSTSPLSSTNLSALIASSS